MSNATLTEKKFYSDQMLFRFVAEGLVDSCTKQNILEVFSCFYRKPFNLGEGPATLEELVQHMLGMMGTLQVKDTNSKGKSYYIIPWEKPRADYLPLAEGVKP